MTITARRREWGKKREEEKGIAKRAAARKAARRREDDGDRDKVVAPPPPPPPEPEPEPVKEVAPPPPPEPTPPKLPTRGRPVSVRRTTGDKYIVRTELKHHPGEYLQEVLTKEQVELRGGVVPPEEKAEPEPEPRVKPKRVRVPEPPEEAPEYQLKEEERGFVKGKDWVAVEWMHLAGDPSPYAEDKTKPTVFVDPQGVRHYTDLSPMWTEYGYRTSTQYYAPGSMAYFDLPSQATTPPPYVPIETAEGVKHITRSEAIKLGKLSSEERFGEMKLMGLIAKEAEYVSPVTMEKAREALAEYKKPDGTYEFAKEVDTGITVASLEKMLGWKLDLPEGAIILSYDPEVGEIEYEIPVPVEGGEDAFLRLVQEGSIPTGATYKGYDVSAGEIIYELPAEAQKVLPVGFVGAVALGEVRAETLFSQMVEAGEVPVGSILKSYDDKTGEFSYELAAEKVLPIGFIGAPAPGEVRPETLFKQMITAGEVPEGSVLVSYDPETGEFNYELPEEVKPLVGKVGVTFADEWRVEVDVSPAVEMALTTVASYLEMFGGARDIKTGTTLEEQLAYIEGVPIARIIPSHLQASVLRMGNMMSLFATDIKSKPTDVLAFVPEVLYTAGTFLPLIGTALTWRDSSNVMRGVNLAIDAAIMFPWLKMGFRSASHAIQKVKDPSKYAVKQLLQAEKLATKGMAQVIRKTYGKEAAKAFIELNKAQSAYVMKLTAMFKAEVRRATAAVRKIDKAIDIAEEQMRFANKAKNWARVRQLEASIANLKARRAGIDPATVAKAKTAEAARRLEAAAETYRDILKKTGVAMDDTLVLASVDEIPRMLVRNTEMAVRETIGRATVSVKSLRKALGNAETKVAQMRKAKGVSDGLILSEVAKQKAGTAVKGAWDRAVIAGKEIDLKLVRALYQQEMALRQLNRAMAHSVSDVWKGLEAKRLELTKARAQLKIAEATEARGGAPAYALRDKVKRLQADVFKLEDDYLTAIKGMEVEMRVKIDPVKGYYAEAEGGIIGGSGRVAVAAPKAEVSPMLLQAMKLAGRKAVPTRVGAGARAPAVRPQFADAVATTTLTSVRIAWKLGEDEFARIAPMVREDIITEIHPLVRAIITPVEAAAMTPEMIRAIEHALKAAIQTAIKTAALMKTTAQIEAKTRAVVASLIKATIKPATKSALQAKAKPIVKTATKVATVTRVRIEVIKRKPIFGKIRLPFARQIAKSPAGQPIPMGSIAWKQGIFWQYIPPPWMQDKPITLKRGVIPFGADTTGGNSPYTTIQMIGRSRKAVVPKHISVDKGVVDIFISERGRKIEFRGGGLETDVGKRLPSPTKGMSVDRAFMKTEAPPRVSEVDMVGEGFPGELMPTREISRPRMSKKKPPRKRRSRYETMSDAEFTRMTTLKGFRP